MIKRKRINNEEFIKEIIELVGEEYVFLEKFINWNTKILAKHNICGHKWLVVPMNFKGNKSKKGTRCPKCQKTHKRTPEEFLADVFNIVGNEYSVLSDFKNAITKVKFKHNFCEYEFEMTANNFLNGQRCPKCANKVFRTTEQFKLEVYEIFGDDYSILGEFKTVNTKLKVRHNICGNEYQSLPTNLLKGHGCNKCRLSHGERAVSNWLIKNNISNTPEYRFDDCRNINPLPFDFAILDSNNKIELLIEYDGEGHFMPFRFSKDVDKNLQKFKDVQLRDSIKNKYCEDNNIPLLRIPYWDFNKIDNILSNHSIISKLISK